MSRVMEAWEQVLREAVSPDYDEQQFAVFQIGVVLQRHNPNITPESDMEEETLSRELLRLSLDERRQRDTVDYLARLVRNHPRAADSFLVAMSNAQAHILVEPLLDLLQEHGAQLSSDAAFHALSALDQVLKYGDEDVLAKVRDADLLDLLDEWAERKHDLLANKADTLAAKIEKLGE